MACLNPGSYFLRIHILTSPVRITFTGSMNQDLSLVHCYSSVDWFEHKATSHWPLTLASFGSLLICTYLFDSWHQWIQAGMYRYTDSGRCCRLPHSDIGYWHTHSHLKHIESKQSSISSNMLSKMYLHVLTKQGPISYHWLLVNKFSC